MNPPKKPIPLPFSEGTGKSINAKGKRAYKPRPHKSGVGQPSKYGERTTKIITGCISQGMSIDGACAMAGVTLQTHRNWMTASEAGEEGFEGYFDRISKALAMSEGVLVKKIVKNKQWQAAAWILQRRFPKTWGAAKVTVAADGGKPLASGPGGVSIIIEGGDAIEPC